MLKVPYVAMWRRIIKAIKEAAQKRRKYKTKVMCVIYKLCSAPAAAVSNVFELKIFHVSSLFAHTMAHQPPNNSETRKILSSHIKCAPYS